MADGVTYSGNSQIREAAQDIDGTAIEISDVTDVAFEPDTLDAIKMKEVFGNIRTIVEGVGLASFSVSFVYMKKSGTIGMIPRATEVAIKKISGESLNVRLLYTSGLRPEQIILERL